VFNRSRDIGGQTFSFDPTFLRPSEIILPEIWQVGRSRIGLYALLISSTWGQWFSRYSRSKILVGPSPYKINMSYIVKLGYCESKKAELYIVSWNSFTLGVGGVVFRAPGDDSSTSARSARSSERVNTNITQPDHCRAVIFATVKRLSYVRSLIAATAEHQVYRTSRSSSIKHQLIELIRQRVHYQAAVSATAECSLYACFISAHCNTSVGIEITAIRRNTRQKTRQRGSLTNSERSSVQQSNACYMYDRSLLQQPNTDVRSR
jgi:hypothetical protein